MYKSSTYSISEFSKKVGRTVKTLQRWDREGILKPSRTLTNRRYYEDSDFKKAMGLLGIESEIKNSKPFVYCRVSSPAQRTDLQNQMEILGLFCAAKGLSDLVWIQEIGGGLNFKRPKFLSLMEFIEKGEVSHLVIAHKDCLVRFGFEWFEHFCVSHGCELLILNQEKLSPEKEMVEDLMSIVHCFSSRLYGLRNYKKSLVKHLGESDVK